MAHPWKQVANSISSLPIINDRHSKRGFQSRMQKSSGRHWPLNISEIITIKFVFIWQAHSEMDFDMMLQSDIKQMEHSMIDSFGLDMFEDPPMQLIRMKSFRQEIFNSEALEKVDQPCFQPSQPTSNEISEESPCTYTCSPILKPTRPSLKPRRDPDSDSDEEYTGEKVKKIKKNSQEKVPGYPTKNLLQNMKGPHIEYIETRLRAKGADPAGFPLLNELHGKPGMNLTQYETLYKTLEFQEILEDFFKEKVLFRALMVSRAVLQTKRTSLKMLKVFENAFRDKKFTKIN